MSWTAVAPVPIMATRFCVRSGSLWGQEEGWMKRPWIGHISDACLLDKGTGR